MKSLQRAHVSEMLQQALSFPLIVCTAPVGYGKSTAARAFMDSIVCPAYYLRVRQGAVNARYLWDDLCDQLIRQGGRLAQVLRDLGFPEDSLATDRVLANICEHIQGRRVLLIDDWHFVEFPEFEALLERIVRERIPGLTIILLSRTRPGIALEELRVKSMAYIMGQEIFAFSQSEAIAYFALHGIRNRAIAREAWQLCDGWAAALWLSVQNYLTNHSITASLDAEALLEQANWSLYSQEEQQLLMQVCIFDDISPQEAALISTDPAAPQLLHNLLKQNAFLEYNASTDRYRLHSIFHAFLTRHLEADNRIDKAALYSRAAECCLMRNDMVLAAQLFLRAGRDEDLLRLLDFFAVPCSNKILFLAARDILPKILAIPWALRMQRPMEYLGLLYSCLVEIGYAEAIVLLDEAEQRFELEPTFSPAFKKRLKGEVVLVRSILRFNDLRAMIAIYEEAHHLLNGRSVIAHRHLHWNFGSPHIGYVFLRTPGTYSNLIDLADDKIHYYKELTDGCGTGVELLCRAEMLMERGEFDDVEALLLSSIHAGRSKEQICTVQCAYFSLARLYIATGKADKAIPLLDSHISEIQSLGLAPLTLCLELTYAYIHALLGNEALIPEWLRKGDISPTQNPFQILGLIHLVHGKALLLSRDYAALNSVAKSIPSCLGPWNNLFGLIHAGIQEAIAVQHLQGIDKALPLLNSTLELACQDNIKLSIAEYGEQILPLLLSLEKREKHQDKWLNSLIKLTNKHIRSVAAVSCPRMKERLTPREKEILDLVAKGKKNADIAELLDISPDTVNKILRSAYARLNVKNRAAAVRKILN